ncbi:MAG: hypothetical protein ACYC61_29800 [Isosphaeraceae bacterium]
MKKARSRGRRRKATVHDAAATQRLTTPPAAAPPVRDRRLAWALAVPIVLLVAAAFWPVLANRFVDWDDEPNFFLNLDYRGIGWPQWHWAWTTFLLGVYQPVAWMILEVEYILWGLDPRGYHLASLALHAGVAVALYALTLDLLARSGSRDPAAPENRRAWVVGAAIATALFAVHPLRVEAIAWASSQPYLPCALFAILAVLAYLRAADAAPTPRRWTWLLLAFLLYAATLLSKAAAVPLAAVLVILDVYPLRRLGGDPGGWIGPRARLAWIEKLPFLLLSLIFAGVAIRAKAGEQSLVPLEHDGIAARLAQACYGVWFYLVKTFIPIDIAAFYPLPARIDPLAPRFLLAIAATLGVTFGLFLLRRRHPAPLAAWLSYLVILAPSSGLVRIGNQIAADRYGYLSMLGLAVLLGAGLTQLYERAARTRAGTFAFASIAGAAMLGLTMLTRAQCGVWRDSETLWSHALAHGGPSATAHYGVASARFRQLRYAEAVRHYTEAARLNPRYAEAFNDLAMILGGCPEAAYRDGKAAVAAATRACELTSWNQPVYLDTLAVACAEAGDFDAAVRWQQKAIDLLVDDRQKDDYRARLRLYRDHQPYHEAAAAPSSADAQGLGVRG